MKDLTVKQLAAISGVTVRTLHHYDDIGLLKPASVSASGYRFYGRKQMLRLQRILFHRELGVPLNEIAELLELEAGDEIGVMLRHREKLVAQRERYRILIATIDRTVANLKGATTMTNAELYSGFSQEQQTNYENWLKQHHGEPMAASIEHSRKAYAKMSVAEQAAAMRDLQEIETALAEEFRQGVDSAADSTARLIARHRGWVATMWGKPCPAEAYAGLADLYLAHPDFVSRYELIAAGFTGYLTAAMKLHAGK